MSKTSMQFLNVALGQLSSLLLKHLLGYCFPWLQGKGLGQEMETRREACILLHFSLNARAWLSLLAGYYFWPALVGAAWERKNRVLYQKNGPVLG